MAFMGTFYPGMKVNPLDLSPNYAGSLMAVTNGIGAMTGVAAPVVVGWLTPEVSTKNKTIFRNQSINLRSICCNSIFQHTLGQWRLVFWISFAIFVVTTVVYSIWASGEVQPWNFPKESHGTIEGARTVQYNATTDKNSTKN